MKESPGTIGRKPNKPLPRPPSVRERVQASESEGRRDSVNVDGVMGFSEMLDEADKLVLEGERGTVTIATAKWGFEARNETELGFAPGTLIRVIEPHESGWWTGQCNDRVGLFPVNRTEPQVVDMAGYAELQRRLLSSPMFETALPPALPDPMVKAAKILGVTEKEAEALAATPSRAQRSTSSASVRPSSHDDSGQSPRGASGPVEMASPRKALSVLGFNDDTPLSPPSPQASPLSSSSSSLSSSASSGLHLNGNNTIGRRGRTGSSAIAKISAKVTTGFRRLTSGGGGAGERGQQPQQQQQQQQQASPSPQQQPTQPSSSTTSPRERVKFAPQPEHYYITSSSSSSSSTTPTKSRSHSDVHNETRDAKQNESPVASTNQQHQHEQQQQDWGDDGSLNEDNLIY